MRAIVRNGGSRGTAAGPADAGHRPGALRGAQRGPLRQRRARVHLRGRYKWIPIPRVIDHEYAGTVVKVGDDITLEELREYVNEQRTDFRENEYLRRLVENKAISSRNSPDARVVEKTIRNWLDRFAERLIEQASYDTPRPGGPSKLTSSQCEHRLGVPQELPTEQGYERQAFCHS